MFHLSLPRGLVAISFLAVSLSAQAGPNRTLVRARDAVEFVDAATGLVAESVPLSGVSTGRRTLAVDGARTRAVALGSFSQFVVLDLTTSPTSVIATHKLGPDLLPTAVKDVVISPDGRWALVAGIGSGGAQSAVVRLADGAILKVNQNSVGLAQQFTATLVAVTPDSTRGFTLGNRAEAVDVFDLSGASPVLLRTVDLDRTPHAITLTHDGATAIVVAAATSGTDGIVFLDTATGDIVQRLSGPSPVGLAGATMYPFDRVALSPDDGFGFVTTSRGTDSVQVFDLTGALPQILHTHGLTSAPVHVEYGSDGRFVLVMCEGPATDAIVFYDPDGDEVARFDSQHAALDYHQPAAMSRDGKVAVAARAVGATEGVSVFDLAGATPVERAFVPVAADYVALSPDDRYAVVDSDAGGTHVIDLATGTLAASFPRSSTNVFTWPLHPIAISLDSTRATVVTDGPDGDVTTIDLTTSPPSLVLRRTDTDRPWGAAIWSPPAHAAALSYGNGCTGTLGIPDLRLTPDPFVGSSPTLSFGNSASGPSSGVLLFGVNTIALPILGCTLLVQPLVNVPVALPPSGFQVPLAIPDEPLLSGLHLFTQGLVLDPAAIGGLAFSPGLDMRFGGL